MNEYEKTLDEASKNGIEVIENYRFKSNRIKGLYCDGTVALNTNMKSTIERRCVLQEEISHHKVNVGNIIPLTNENQKEEQKARLYAYDKLIGLKGIIASFENHIRTLHEMAEFLDITEDVLFNALELYKRKYGTSVKIGNYILTFEPYLSVTKLI